LGPLAKPISKKRGPALKITQLFLRGGFAVGALGVARFNRRVTLPDNATNAPDQCQLVRRHDNGPASRSATTILLISAHTTRWACNSASDLLR
jgi:hypothetical protein